MTGKITVGTIQDTDGNTVASTYVTNGSAKAFAHFDVDAVLDNSLNMSSATDNGVGLFTVTNTNPFAYVNFIVSGSVVGATMTYYACYISAQGAAKTSSTAPISTYHLYDAIGIIDVHKMQVVEHGDLA